MAISVQRIRGERVRTLLIVLAAAIMTAAAAAPSTTIAREGDDDERRLVVNRLEVMHVALPALREAERHAAVDDLCRAIHAYEMMVGERKDPAARIVRARAPKDERIIDLLAMAEEIYRDHDAPDRADMIARQVDELWLRHREQRHEGDRARSEREVARHHIEIMRLGMPALLEAGRRDTAELLEHAIHARELGLEGRRDAEAIEIRESAPGLGEQIEILNYAADLWDEFGHEGKAGQLRELAAHYREAWERRRGGEEREHRREDDRARAHRHLEIMHYALGAYREVDARDAVDLMHRAIRAREVALEGRRGREARQIAVQAPEVGTQIELLQRASGILREFGAGEKAAAVHELAEHLAAESRRSTESRRRDRGSRDDFAREVEEIEERLARLHAAVEEALEQLEEVRARMR